MAYFWPCKIIRLHPLSLIDHVSTPRAAQHFFFPVPVVPVVSLLFSFSSFRSNLDAYTVGTSPVARVFAFSFQLGCVHGWNFSLSTFSSLRRWCNVEYPAGCSAILHLYFLFSTELIG